MAKETKGDPETRAMGARLKEARIAAGYSDQIDFYSAFKISQSSYSHYEAGTRGLGRVRARKFAELLGNVSHSWLLTGQGEPPKQLPRKTSAGKRAAPVEGWEAEHGSDLSEEEKAELIRIWGTISKPIRVAALTLIRAAIRPAGKVG